MLKVEDFRQKMPGDGQPVSLPTTAYLSFDDKNLYAVFVCTDDSGLVRGRRAKREHLDNDDDASFDTLWHTRGRPTDKGYVVWIAEDSVWYRGKSHF
jgi:hypothetical protein